MPVQEHFPSSHSNQYGADSACGHCYGIIRHEHWCITQNESVQYAYQVVSDTSQLSPGDHLILHALGTAWTGKRILSKPRCEQVPGKFNIKEFGGHDAF
jgi:hypothetical protein